LCKPKDDARVFHVDSDPLKQQMPVFYIPAEARFKADCYVFLKQLNDHITSSSVFKQKLETYSDRWQKLQDLHSQRLKIIKDLARPGKEGYYNASYLCSEIRKAVPEDTIFAVEAVTSTCFVADQLLPKIPGTWINCGGGGLGWSSGGALGIKLAAGEKRFVCQIVGDGTFLFSVPGSAYWISQRYKLPILTIVLNNQGNPIPFHPQSQPLNTQQVGTPPNAPSSSSTPPATDPKQQTKNSTPPSHPRPITPASPKRPRAATCGPDTLLLLTSYTICYRRRLIA
jgi:thiamine pyrophosphate-dependent acetolactate synthase large subunit-like protein